MWWLTYSQKRVRREGKAQTKNYDQEVILDNLRQTLLQHRVHFPDSAEKRPSRLHTRLMRFSEVKCQVLYKRTLTNSHLPHNRGHGFQKFKSLQRCPNLAHHKLSRSTKDIPSPRKARSVSESRFTRHIDNGKTRPARPPDCANKSR